jgi:hypothetical protein
VAEFSLTSGVFAAGGTIPRRHACDGEDRSPPLSWSPSPTGTRSLVLILDDLDAPGGRFIHWLAWGIPRTQAGLARGRQRRWRGATTSARSATAAHAHPAGTAVTATASSSTPWPRSSGSRPAPACGSWSGPSRPRTLRLRSSLVPTSADPVWVATRNLGRKRKIDRQPLDVIARRWPGWSAVGAAGCGPLRTADAWYGCATCRSVAGRWCSCGASGSGAVVSPPVKCGPGPSGWPGSVRGRC